MEELSLVQTLSSQRPTVWKGIFTFIDPLKRFLISNFCSLYFSLKAFDVLIKGGEWKLGSDEEPKPFQTIRVKSISFHPEYQSAIFGRDIALLHLENPLKFDKHIGAICIDANDVQPNPIADICVTTGWGKEVLKCK